MELREDLTALLPYATMVEGSSDETLTPKSVGTAGVLVPWGGRLSFYVDLPNDAELRLSARFVGPHSGRLRISVETDGGGEHPMASVDRTTAALTVSLGEESGGATRLSMWAETSSAGRPQGGVLLEDPTIWARAPQGRVESTKPGPQTADHQRKSPNVLIYLVDTLRPDHLGCYGYPRAVSPNVDAFAEQAVLFEYAVGQASWTKPAVASIFTGLWPRSHGALRHTDKLPDELTTLAEALLSAGYRTAAVLTNPNVSKVFAFDQGFEDVMEKSEDEIGYRQIVADAIQWLDSERMEEPFFLYVHTTEPHNPYQPRGRFLEEFAPNSEEVIEIIRRNPRKEIWDSDDRIRDQLVDLYDAEIATNDAKFGELVAFLKERNLFEPTLIIFVSDHGEEFLEHRRWGHGRNLHVEELNVALLVKFPGQTSGYRVSEPVQHIDLFPTILENIGVAATQPLQGRVLGAFAGGKWSSLLTADEPIFSHIQLGQQTSVVSGNYKLVQRRRAGSVARESLYDWRNDPRERHDLSADLPILAATLAAKVARKLAEARPPKAEKAVLDAATEERLRALGYVN